MGATAGVAETVTVWFCGASCSRNGNTGVVPEMTVTSTVDGANPGSVTVTE